MTKIACLKDLEAFGFDLLTGEACSLGLRCLTQVTETGRRILCRALGVRDLALADNWNPPRPGELYPPVGSIMLDYHAWDWLAPFALFDRGFKRVYRVSIPADQFLRADQFWCAFGPDEYQVETMDLWAQSKAQVRDCSLGIDGDRNMHRMSGRVE